MATLNYGWIPPVVAGSSGTWGTLLNTLIDAVDAQVKLNENATKMAVGALGTTGAIALSLTTNRYFTIVPSGAVTFSITNVPAGSFAFAIMVRISNAAGQTIAWPASVKWPGGVAPSFVTVGTHLAMLVTDDGGTTWRGNGLMSFA